MKVAILSLFTLAALCAPPAAAGPITFSISAGNRAAEATFARSGNDLIVTLTNTSTADALVPTDILTAIYVAIDGDPVLTPVSVMVPASSSVLVGPSGTNVTPADRVVGGEWAYTENLPGLSPANQGISSVGLGIFGPPDRFPGNNLQGPTSPAGVQYGITTAGDNLSTGNGGISGEHLIKNSVVITLSGFTAEPSEAITHVTFQYGTDLNEPQFIGVPEPSSALLATIGLASLALGRRRRRPRS